MKKKVALFVAALSLGASATQAEAKGCVAGAAVGGVAGHVAGHHAVLGAAAGCAINHHRNKVKAEKAEKAGKAATAQPVQGEPAQATRPARDPAH